MHRHRTAFMLTLALLLTLVARIDAASATQCAHLGWVKSTALGSQFVFWDKTISEVYAEGDWVSGGPSACYGLTEAYWVCCPRHHVYGTDGIDPDPTDSYPGSQCRWRPSDARPRPPGSNCWYTQPTDGDPYYVFFSQVGHFSGCRTTSSPHACIRADNAQWSQYVAMSDTYAGQFSKTCNHWGTFAVGIDTWKCEGKRAT